jgi:hypothetical protein
LTVIAVDVVTAARISVYAPLGAAIGLYLSWSTLISGVTPDVQSWMTPRP